MKRQAKILLAFAAVCFCTYPSVLAKENPGQKNQRVAKVNAGLPYALMNGNNVTSWIHSDGFFNWLVNQSWNGEFPKASGVGTIFSEGIVFGGFVNDGLYSKVLRVTGDSYQVGMAPGAIHADGSVDPSSALSSRAFAIRPDLPASIESDPTKWPDLTVDAATYLQKAQASVSEVDKSTIAAQYFTDWKEWPAAKGAPWYIDSIKVVRNDNAYDPTNPHHVPGIPDASKTIWFVCNDQDTAVTKSFAGSPPLGVEEQMTIWAYTSSDALNNIVFKQVKLIYKANPGSPINSRIDSMYVVQWADPDVGDVLDDYAGCDSALSLNYVWNSRTVDAKYAAVGLPAPATGFVYLQGASHFTGNASDSAMINFQWRHGYKYWHDLPMTAACFFGAGSTISDPDIGPYSGTQQWFNLMRGDLPRPAYPAGRSFWAAFANPNAFPTTFVQSGDPTTGTGWLDGYDMPPGDRRTVTVHGPFSMNKGDTAEVVIALIDAIGADNLSSVRVLKSSAAFAKSFYNELPFKVKPPRISYAATYSSSCTVSFQADARGINVAGIVVSLKSYSGTLVGSDTLADDGLHNDGAPNDKIFGGSIQIPQQQSGLYVDANIKYLNGGKVTWPNVVDNISTAGPLVITTPVVVSDNLNSDGIPNPGENVRFTFTMMNSSSVNLGHLSVTMAPLGKTIFFGTLSSTSSATLHYDPSNSGTYFDFNVPANITDSTYSIPILVTDSLSNIWRDTVRFPVRQFHARPYTSPVIHTSGRASGNFNIVVVDQAAIKNHAYQIQGADSIDPARHIGITLTDLTINAVVFANHPLPDSLGHTMPVTDGFKILRGTTLDGSMGIGMTGWSIPAGVRRFSPVAGFSGLGLEGFSSPSDSNLYDVQSGTIGMAGHFAFGGIGTSLTSNSQYHTVLLRLAAVDSANLWTPMTLPSDTNYSLGYRWLRNSSAAPADPSFVSWIKNTGGGYQYQDFNYSVPFSAWDMDQNPPLRLTVGMLENNVLNGLVDGRYWPPTASAIVGVNDNTVAREFCFIFSKPYSTIDDPTFHVNLSSNSSLPLMWVMTCTRRQGSSWSGTDQFKIIAAHLPAHDDIWTFNPTVTGVGQQIALPMRFSLSQNYPNPFNPATTIRYQIPTLSRVTVRIYNLLGQEVRTLVNGIQNAGEQSAIWDSKNNVNQTVSSGVYFYRIQATSTMQTRRIFTDVKKMLLIK
jgi:hypothetical protein